MIEITPTAIEGVRFIRPTARCDERGRFVKILQDDVFALRGIPTRFAEQYYSVSAKNVLRGLHFQTPPHHHDKLVSCVAGDVIDAVVDLRKGSPTYGQHLIFELDGLAGESVFVPSGCAHGFYVRSETAVMMYNVGSIHVPTHDSGIRWDSAGIDWPSRNPTLSPRDASFVGLADFDTPFLFSPSHSPQASG